MCTYFFVQVSVILDCKDRDYLICAVQDSSYYENMGN